MGYRRRRYSYLECIFFTRYIFFLFYNSIFEAVSCLNAGKETLHSCSRLHYAFNLYAPIILYTRLLYSSACVISVFFSCFLLRELYVADIHKLGVYRGGGALAITCDLFRGTPSRDCRGCRDPVVWAACFEGDDKCCSIRPPCHIYLSLSTIYGGP